MGVDTMAFAALLMAAYLLGSIPTGLLLGKIWGVDVRKEGSGNIGATNLYRTVGRSVGVVTLVGDCLKGVLPVLLAKYYDLPHQYVALIGLAAFCGHVFSIFLKFRGGKGVATALGVFLVLSPVAVALALAVFVGLMLVWRYVSLGSIMAAALMPLAVALLGSDRTTFLVTLSISVVVILKHHGNIRRLLEGSENRFKA